MNARKFFTSFFLITVPIFVNGLCVAQKPELVVQTGHSDSVNSVAFSANGRLLASGSSDHTVKLWEVETGRELRTLRGHSESVITVAFSLNSRFLASAGYDRTIVVWDLSTGRQLHRLVNHADWVTSVVFSADARFLLSSSFDKTIKLWDVNTGAEVRTFRGFEHGLFSAVINKDGTLVAGAGFDKTIKLWNAATGEFVRELAGHAGVIESLAFVGDGKKLVSGGRDHAVKIWEVESGRELLTLKTGSSEVHAVAVSPDGRKVAAESDYADIKLWDVGSGLELKMPDDDSHGNTIHSLAFSPDGKTLASCSFDQTIKIWDLQRNKHLRTLSGHVGEITAVALSTDGKTLAAGAQRKWGDTNISLWHAGAGSVQRIISTSSQPNSLAFNRSGTVLAAALNDNTVSVLEVAAGNEMKHLVGHKNDINPMIRNAVYDVMISPDGKVLATGSSDNTLKLWDVNKGVVLRTLTGHSAPVASLAFNADGTLLASGSWEVKLWDTQTGREVRTLAERSDWSTVAFSPSGQILAGSVGREIKLWDVGSGRELRKLAGHPVWIAKIAFSPDGKKLASCSGDETIKLWDVETGAEIRTFRGHSNSVRSVVFSADGRLLLSGSTDATTKIWSVASGETLATLITLDQEDWAVVAPDGRFDASPNGQKLMHWIVGSEPVELDQLKQRYYEPGLLAKVLKGEPLRDVSKFENPKLYPEVQYEPPVKGSSLLNVTLTNHGGGIGRVQVFLNDREFIADARDDKLRANPDVPRATLTIDLSKAPGVITGAQNEIRVVAWNEENYISSRGEEKPWVVEGAASKEPPEVYALIAGISRYSGRALDLKYAAKDSIDIANAIELGAKRLFGADKVHLTLLTTASDTRAIPPTKENFLKAFAAMRQSKPKDILIVYLAGHAITVRQSGNDIYCYLTNEADSIDVSDPEVRRARTITSDELRDNLQKIPANKQAVMLDTCAAGAAQEQFMAAARSGSGDAVRAIELAMDRTGSHFLMGSAADAESFETSQYGQGLLTYALLKGIKGQALDDAGILDVNTLFRFAREEVEKLAREIEKIQKPKISEPKGDTFPVGRLTREDTEKIVLAKQRPLILRPNFQEAQSFIDTLELARSLRELLRNETSKSRGASEVLFEFSNIEEFSGGIRPIGRYEIEGDRVTVELRLQRDKSVAFSTRVIGTKTEITEKILDAIKTAIDKL